MTESARKRVFWIAFWVAMAIQVIAAVAFTANDGWNGNGSADYAAVSTFVLIPLGVAATPIGWIVPGVVGAVASRIAHPKTVEERYAPAKRGPDGDFPGDWADVLYRAKENYQIKSPVGTANQIYAQAGSSVVPERSDVFRAFRMTPLNQVKVVVIGQDPYPQEGRADGLAFAQRGAVASDSSLHRIFMSMESDPDLGFARPQTGDLSKWATQGVLLLNRALTTDIDTPGSHFSQWEQFVTAVVAAVRDRREHVAFICMGREAVNLVDGQLHAASDHLIIRSAHPMARDLKKSDLERLSEARPFSTANDYLVRNGSAPIDWTL